MNGGLHAIDWVVLLAYLGFALWIGLRTSEVAGKDAESYFLAGRSTPWWWAGLSMAATTFAADTPLAVTGIIAARGLSGNWMWLSWIGVHAAVVVVFARLWSRAGVITDAELLSRRYSGTPAELLRWARALLYGLVINVLTLGWVLKAMRAIAAPFFPWRDWLPGLVGALDAVWPAGGALGTAEEGLTVLLLLLVAGVYSSLGGIRGVMQTDIVQLALALGGSSWFAWRAWQAVGGREGLHSSLELLYGPEHYYLDLWPRLEGGWVETLAMGPVLLGAYLVVQSFSNVPADGGGYYMQRLNSTPSPREARKAMLLFVLLQYLLRVWPWFLVGLAALALIPIGGEAAALGGAAGAVAGERQLAYPYLLAHLLGPGARGLLVTSLLAAFMSTVDTHLNWGSSYVVQDVYLRMKPEARPEEQIRAGRLAVLGFVLAAVLVSFHIQEVAGAWRWVGALGAALGLPTMLRWIWWRVNAAGELAGAGLGLLVALALASRGEMAYEMRLVWTSAASLVGLLAGIALGPATDTETLEEFTGAVRPPGFWPGRTRGQGAGQLLRLGARTAGLVVGVGLGLHGSHAALLRGAWGEALGAGVAALVLLLVSGLGGEDEE